MAVVYPDENLLSLIENFGLDPAQVEKFTLNIEAGALVTVDVKMTVTPDQFKYAIDLLRRYELNEIKCQEIS